MVSKSGMVVSCFRNSGFQTAGHWGHEARNTHPAPALADSALTKVAAKVRCADDLLTEKNCLNRSKPEYFHLHRKRENMRKKPHQPRRIAITEWGFSQYVADHSLTGILRNQFIKILMNIQESAPLSDCFAIHGVKSHLIWSNHPILMNNAITGRGNIQIHNRPTKFFPQFLDTLHQQKVLHAGVNFSGRCHMFCQFLFTRSKRFSILKIRLNQLVMRAMNVSDNCKISFSVLYLAK